MYEPSVGFYNSVIQAQVRRLDWHGVLTDTDGVAHSFTADNIVANTGAITKAAASTTEISLGTVYASQLSLGLYIDDIGVSRAKIYGGTITLACTVTAGLNSGNVPLGVFTIAEALQNGELCSITAYDAMVKFDKAYLGVSGLATPYNWALSFCQKCGVTLGTTEDEFAAFPNGDLNLTLIWNDDIETYRDALSHLASAVGCVATIDRDGELVFLPLASSAPVATVRAGDRFDSDIAHTTYKPKTIYLTLEETGETVTATQGNGNAYLDIGTNALLQTAGKIRDLTGETIGTRTVGQMLNAVIASAMTFSSVPLEAEIPCDPCLDLFDAVTLTGGQADIDGTLVKITGIEVNIGRDTKIKCAGANTAEAKTAEARATGNKDGGADTLMWQSTDMNEDDIVITFSSHTWGDLASFTWGSQNVYTWGHYSQGSSGTIITETTVTPQKDWARGQLNFTVNYELDAAAEITYRVIVDSEVFWELTEDQEAGRVVKTITTPVDLWSNTETTHNIKITMAGEAAE